MNLYAEAWFRCRNVASTARHPRRSLAVRAINMGMPDHPEVFRLLSPKSKWRRAAARLMKHRSATAKKPSWAEQRREMIYRYHKALGYHGIVEWEF